VVRKSPPWQGVGAAVVVVELVVELVVDDVEVVLWCTRPKWRPVITTTTKRENSPRAFIPRFTG
jgi:hypothetical protein